MSKGKDEHGQFLLFTERITKTRQGTSSEKREAPPRAYENAKNPSRCPVKLYDFFKDCRPTPMQEADTPFFLAINHKAVDPSNPKAWFKNAHLGKNKLGNLMKDMAKEAGLEGKLCNHTVRKTALTNLLQAGFAPTTIKRISGHKNEHSIGNYATASNAQVKLMNEVLLNPTENVPPFGPLNSHLITKEDPPPTLNTSTLPNSESTSNDPRASAVSDYSSDKTHNQTDASDLLRNATLSNCTFNISYTILGDKK